MRPIEKIKLIKEWAEDRPEFDTKFVESVRESLEKYGHLTQRQEAALDNIINKFRIGEETWEL